MQIIIPKAVSPSKDSLEILENSLMTSVYFRHKENHVQIVKLKGERVRATCTILGSNLGSESWLESTC